MQVQFSRPDALNAALSAARATTAEYVDRPALKGVLIEVNADTFEASFTGTDLFSSVCAKIPAAVLESGAALVNAQVFTEILKRCSNNIVVCSQEGDEMKIVCGESEFKIPLINEKDFIRPKFPDYSDGPVVKGSELKQLVARTIIAVGHSAKSEATRNVTFSCRNQVLTAMASDGAQAAYSRLDLPGVPDLTLRFTPKSLALLCSVLANAEEYHIVLGPNALTVWGRIIMLHILPASSAGAMDLESILRGLHPKRSVAVKAADMLSALKFASVLRPARVLLQTTSGGLLLSNELDDEKKMSLQLEAAISQPLPPAGYWYEADKLARFVQSLPGDANVTLKFDDAGLLSIQFGVQDFVLTPCVKARRIAKPSTKQSSKKKAA